MEKFKKIYARLFKNDNNESFIDLMEEIINKLEANKKIKII